MKLAAKREKLTDRIARGLAVPATGYQIVYDAAPPQGVPGFGVRITAQGARSYILNYRTRTDRDRRFTIGSVESWSAVEARKYARAMRVEVDQGRDPQEEKQGDRDAKTVSELCDRYVEEFLPATLEEDKRPKGKGKARLRESSQWEYAALIKNIIRPSLGTKKLASLSFSEVDAMHRKITKGLHRKNASKGAPYTANRTVAVLSKMINQAIKWKWCDNNPTRGIERNHEEKRERYLSPEEIVSLGRALDEMGDKQAASIIGLLLLTGARRGETLAARWADFDLVAGVWTKPGASTKQRTTHRIPLSAPARQLLSDLRAAAPHDQEYVFPGKGVPHRRDIKHHWKKVCQAAGFIDAAKQSTARLHDLRHTYGSVLASSGLSLPIIGALLGHRQPSTTARYSHLMDDPLREATERLGSIVKLSIEGAKALAAEPQRSD